MTTKRVFVIQNQFHQYLDKHSGWHSGKDANALFRVDYHDQALNMLLEINSKDIDLRGRIIEVDTDDKKRPVVEISADAVALDKHQDIAAPETTEMEYADLVDEEDVEEPESELPEAVETTEDLED